MYQVKYWTGRDRHGYAKYCKGFSERTNAEQMAIELVRTGIAPGGTCVESYEEESKR